MKIGVSATFLGSRYSGIAMFTDRLVECLRLSGHEVVIYTASKRFENNRRVITRRTPESLTTDAGSTASFRRFAWMQTVMRGQVKRDGVELLVCPSVEGLLTPPVPQVITVHDIIPLLYPEENPLQHHFYRRIVPRLLRQAKLIIAVSEHTKADLVKVYGVPPDRVTVATSGIEMEPCEANRSRPSPQPYFLYLGTFSPRKNLETLLRAFARVAPSIRENLIVVAYPDVWQPKTIALTKRLKISHRVIFESDVPASELADLYRGATALVLLSEYEGFGLPPLEAMILGTPAIVSDTTSLSEVTAGGALQVPCKDVSAAAEAMQMLSTVPGLRDKYSRLGKLRAAQFTQAQCAVHLRHAIEPMLSGG